MSLHLVGHNSQPCLSPTKVEQIRLLRSTTRKVNQIKSLRNRLYQDRPSFLRSTSSFANLQRAQTALRTSLPDLFKKQTSKYSISASNLDSKHGHDFCRRLATSGSITLIQRTFFLEMIRKALGVAQSRRRSLSRCKVMCSDVLTCIQLSDKNWFRFKLSDCSLHLSRSIQTSYTYKALTRQQWFSILSYQGQAKKVISCQQLSRSIWLT